MTMSFKKRTNWNDFTPSAKSHGEYQSHGGISICIHLDIYITIVLRALTPTHTHTHTISLSLSLVRARSVCSIARTGC